MIPSSHKNSKRHKNNLKGRIECLPIDSECDKYLIL